jgi:hypothetical protein
MVCYKGRGLTIVLTANTYHPFSTLFGMHTAERTVGERTIEEHVRQCFVVTTTISLPAKLSLTHLWVVRATIRRYGSQWISVQGGGLGTI